MRCKCSYSCRQLDRDAMERLFIDFYSLAEAEQGTYIMGLMGVIPVQRRRHGTYATPCNSRRQCTVVYHVPDGKGNTVQVCGGTFRTIFAISPRKLQTLQMKKKQGHTSYVDMRGNKEVNNKKYTEEDRRLIRLHILSFPREESHYSRHKSKKEYLSPDLSLNRLHKAFVERYPQTTVHYKYYSSVYRKEFPNLSFGRPRTDTCCTCDRLTVLAKSDSRNKKKHTSDLELHQRKAEKAVTLLKNSTVESQVPTSTICTLTMDLQQVMFTPTLTHSAMFYARQLSSYNFCVHVGDTNDSYMCMWHEGIAGRGGNEMASCLLKVLRSGFTQKPHLNIWCDNCTGQNKNRMILFVLIYLVSAGNFLSITLNFLVSGHSYMACDRDFGLIEKRKRVMKAMVPSELQDVVRSARVNNPFKVVNMDEPDFYDIAKDADSFISTTKLNISKASVINVNAANPTKVKLKASFNELVDWDEVQVLKKGKRASDIRNKKLSPLGASNRISQEKKKDLLGMLDYLDVGYHEFYKSFCLV